MYTFILIADKKGLVPTAAEILERLDRPVRQEPDDGRCMVESEHGMGDGWIAVTRNDDVASDYEPEVLLSIREKIADPAFYFVEAPIKNVPFAELLISRLDPRVNWLIDNDAGYIGPLVAFKYMIDAGVDWRDRSAP